MEFEEIENKIYESEDEISTEKGKNISFETKNKIFKFILFSVIILGVIYVAWHYLGIWIESQLTVCFPEVY